MAISVRTAELKRRCEAIGSVIQDVVSPGSGRTQFWWKGAQDSSSFRVRRVSPSPGEPRYNTAPSGKRGKQPVDSGLQYGRVMV